MSNVDCEVYLFFREGCGATPPGFGVSPVYLSLMNRQDDSSVPDNMSEEKWWDSCSRKILATIGIVEKVRSMAHLSARRVVKIGLMVCSIMLAGCDNQDDSLPPPPQMPPSLGSALITPGVNPAFDTITEVALSESAGSNYTAIAGVEYDAATETIALAEGAVPDGGAYVRITGQATVGGVSAPYTLYTYVASNTDNTAANELTSLAVGFVAEGTAGDFAVGVARVAAAIDGVSSVSITAPATEAGRDFAVRAAMIAIFNQFANGGFVPGPSDTGTILASCV